MEVEDNAYLTQTPKWDSICSITKYSAIALCLRFFLLFSLPKPVSRLLEESAATYVQGVKYVKAVNCETERKSGLIMLLYCWTQGTYKLR